MKKLFLQIAVAAALCACAPKATVTVENTLGFDRSAELVEIPVEKLHSISLGFDDTYVVRNSAGEVVPSQWTYDNRLLFQSGLGANGKATFTIEAGEPRDFPVKARARFAPERFDDMIWENDRVAFRIYGAALMAKDGPSNGIDALYKRSEEMVIDQWYEGELQKGMSYHSDHGTGLDDYNVKRTLGAGGAAPFLYGKLILNTNFTGHEILDNGPLRATFRLTYPDLETGAATAAETRTISLDAGSQLTRVTQEYGVDAPMVVAVGYPLHADDAKCSSWGNVLMLGEPATSKSSGVSLGAVLPQDFGEGEVNEYEVPAGEKGAGVYRHILAAQLYTPGSPLTYYTGFGWEKHGGWTAEKFAEYLDRFNWALETPFVVEIKQ